MTMYDSEDCFDAHRYEQECAADERARLTPPDPTVHDIRCQVCGCTVRLRMEKLGAMIGECRICNIGYCVPVRITAGRAT